MLRWTGLDQIPKDFGPSVVTIGNFDGVHRGHQQVISRMCQQARSEGWAAAAITFFPHPAHVHRPESAEPLITGLADRIELLGDTGLDAVLIVDYTLKFADQTPEEFVENYLVNGLGVKRVVVGRDVRFGRHNSGDLRVLIDLGQRFGFEVVVIPDVGNHVTERWSSTRVRELLSVGQVAEAGRILGRAHRVRGVVVHGNARGRDLGFPTANLSPDATGFVPADGVYAGLVTRPQLLAADPRAKAADLPTAISIGTNPTFEGTERHIEAYVLGDHTLDLYDEEIIVEFVDYLRPTLTFTNIDDLVTQMHVDVSKVADRLTQTLAQWEMDAPPGQGSSKESDKA